MKMENNYWDTVKQEYNESEITKELYCEWIENSDPIRMTQIYLWINNSCVSPLVYIPRNIKINYGE